MRMEVARKRAWYSVITLPRATAAARRSAAINAGVTVSEVVGHDPHDVGLIGRGKWIAYHHDQCDGSDQHVADPPFPVTHLSLPSFVASTIYLFPRCARRPPSEAVP